MVADDLNHQSSAIAQPHSRRPASGLTAAKPAVNGPDQSGHAANGPDQSEVAATGPDQTMQAASSPAPNALPQSTTLQEGLHGAAPASDAHQPSTSAFVFDEGARQKLTSILQQYEGTHNFHNFTVRLEATDPSVKRYMLSCRCTGIFQIQVGLDRCGSKHQR